MTIEKYLIYWGINNLMQIHNILVFRTNVESADISSLYQFADQTGVLDRHRQLLSQPFNENQVSELLGT